MHNATLKYIRDELSREGINYQFGEWSSDPIPNVYFVGEYDEFEPEQEDGLQEINFRLTGVTNKTWLQLEEKRAIIESVFNKISGNTAILEGGLGVAVFYTSTTIIPVDNYAIKRLQINLKILEWSVR